LGVIVDAHEPDERVWIIYRDEQLLSLDSQNERSALPTDIELAETPTADFLRWPGENGQPAAIDPDSGRHLGACVPGYLK
jgi:hypothetical protein